MRLDLWNAAFRSSVVAYASSGNLDVRWGDRSRFGLSDWTAPVVGANPYPRIGRRLARGGRARTESLTSSPPGTRSLPERETILSFMVSRVESSRGAGDSGEGIVGKASRRQLAMLLIKPLKGFCVVSYN